jgi:hypothetical protein
MQTVNPAPWHGGILTAGTSVYVSFIEHAYLGILKRFEMQLVMLLLLPSLVYGHNAGVSRVFHQAVHNGISCQNLISIKHKNGTKCETH